LDNQSNPTGDVPPESIRNNLKSARCLDQPLSDEFTQADEYNIYPNPADNEITVVLLKGEYTIGIQSLHGITTLFT